MWFPIKAARATYTQKLEVITSTVLALGNLNRVDKSTAERWVYKKTKQQKQMKE